MQMIYISSRNSSTPQPRVGIAGESAVTVEPGRMGTEPLDLHDSIASVMHRHMRTTIDVPDDLLKRARPVLAERNMTFRALVIDAVERAIRDPLVPFKLRDASAGEGGGGVSPKAINRAIDEAREPSFPG